jgi:hypothetical protein
MGLASKNPPGGPNCDARHDAPSTATRPNRLADDAYPSQEAIGTAWKGEIREAVYFHENRRAGITTVEDGAILKDVDHEA